MRTLMWMENCACVLGGALKWGKPCPTPVRGNTEGAHRGRIYVSEQLHLEVTLEQHSL
jgi:hypothetical protein